jgi:hypothetical protein
MTQPTKTLREACAAGACPDALETAIDEVAHALARLKWLHDYERAEAHYWRPA